MSEVDVIIKFEFLPNEILIECFEYLNALDIFYSFDQLNFRFNKLIRTISLHINCQNIRRTLFNQFSKKIFLNPEIKTQIPSIHLSNKNTCTSINMFLSLFSLDQFPHLRSLTLTEIKMNNIEQLKTMLPLISELTCFRLIDPQNKTEDLLAELSVSNLRILSIPILDSILTSTHQLSSIKNLIISQCSLEKLCYLIRSTPMLKYLNVQHIYKSSDSLFENECCIAVHLKQFIVKNFCGNFDDIKILLKQMSNLKSLTISNDSNEDMIDANRWKDLIIFSLSQLIIFKFKFTSNLTDDFLNKFQEFQTDFWHEQHHWFTEYVSYGYSVYIYTIPYILNSFILTLRTNRYIDKLLKINLKTFDNVLDLVLYQETITLKNSYYFPNVAFLTLENNLYLEDIDDHFLEMKHLDFLKKIVNLSNVKHLTISSSCEIESSSVLLQLLKQTPQLSSISIELQYLQSFFNDDDLCKYLNKLIIKLDIFKHPYKSFGNSEKLKQFCAIFSNLEQLICHINQNNDLLFLLTHLSKLSIMKVQLSNVNNLENFIYWLENETQKFNLTIHIEFENKYKEIFNIWIDK